VLWVKNKTRVVRILFFEMDLCSAIQIKRSWQELSIDMAKHSS